MSNIIENSFFTFTPKKKKKYTHIVKNFFLKENYTLYILLQPLNCDNIIL